MHFPARPNTAVSPIAPHISHYKWQQLRCGWQWRISSFTQHFRGLEESTCSRDWRCTVWLNPVVLSTKLGRQLMLLVAWIFFIQTQNLCTSKGFTSAFNRFVFSLRFILHCLVSALSCWINFSLKLSGFSIAIFHAIISSLSLLPYPTCSADCLKSPCVPALWNICQQCWRHAVTEGNFTVVFIHFMRLKIHSVLITLTVLLLAEPKHISWLSGRASKSQHLQLNEWISITNI